MKRILIFVLVIVALLVTGCSQETQQPNESTYYLEHGLDAAQYCSFTNKQITAVINQLSSQMLLAIKADNMSVSDLAKGAEESLAAITAAREQVEAMHPPANYQSNHENTLRMMQNAEADVQKMIDILNVVPVDYAELSALASKMQVDFIALTSEFNVYYK